MVATPAAASPGLKQGMRGDCRAQLGLAQMLSASGAARLPALRIWLILWLQLM